MTEFIIRYLCPTTYRAIRGEGYQAAIKDILVFKDRIYTGPVTLIGNGQSLINTTCLGGGKYGLTIIQSPPYVALRRRRMRASG